MEILTLDQIRAADEYTINQQRITPFKLMERVALACTERILKLIPEETPITVYCGQGNNGGDGLLIAKYLRKEGLKVEVIVLRHTDSPSENFLRASKEVSHIELEKIADWNQPKPQAWLIDAIIGSGLKRPLEGFLADIVGKLNKLPNPIFSIDIPSGLSCDGIINELSAIYSRHTLTIQWPKLGLLLAPENRHTESFEVIDASIERPTDDLNFRFLTLDFIANLFERRSTFSHKGSYGSMLILAGSEQYSGAALLATGAALRSGAGKVILFSDESTLLGAKTRLPETITTSSIPANLSVYSTLLIGPGLGVSDHSKNLVRKVLSDFSKPIVFDADAINILGQKEDWKKDIPEASILTPHLIEFQRLTGFKFLNAEGMNKAIEFSKKHKCYLVVKGPYTLITSPDGLHYFNSTGNSGLAKAGSGDVLSGLIAGLVCRGYSSLNACLIGVFLHGLSADITAKEQDVESMLPSDIIDHFSAAFRKIKSD